MSGYRSGRTASATAAVKQLNSRRRLVQSAEVLGPHHLYVRSWHLAEIRARFEARLIYARYFQKLSFAPWLGDTQWLPTGRP